jgi:hypothetical protein
MSEIKDRQDAASDIDPIVAALADDMANDTANDSWAAAAVEGLAHGAEADPVIDAAEVTDDLPAAEVTVVDAVSGAATELGDAPDAPFDFVTAQPVDSVASVLPSDAVPDVEDLTPADLTLASEAMPTELAASAEQADEAEAAFAEALTYTALPEAPAPETVPFDQMTAAYADTIVEVEARAEDDHDTDDDHDADDDGPLLDGELEDGIASIFAALQAAQDRTRDGETIEPLGDLEAAEGVTFRLLGELDRLWHRAA